MSYGVGGLVGRITSLLPIVWMCLIWLNMGICSWRFVIKILLSLRAFMSWILLHLPVSCWLDKSCTTCCTVVGSLLQMMRIQTTVIYIAGNEIFHGTCSSPRRAVCYHYLVISENYLLIVGIGPILNKELELIFRSDCSDCTCVYS